MNVPNIFVIHVSSDGGRTLVRMTLVASVNYLQYRYDYAILVQYQKI